MCWMKQQKHKKQLPQFATFNAVYCSGFFINDGTLVTTMCLLFEKVWLLNFLELAINFSKKFKLNLPEDIDAIMTIKPVSPDAEGIDPLAELIAIQRNTAKRYLYVADKFCEHYRL